MASKRKFKRDYIMLEAKDLNFRYKDKVSPKAFAKIEVTDDKSIIALYVENLKYVSNGYDIVLIRSDYETINLGSINVNEQGKGESTFNMGDEDIDIKGIAIIYDRNVPLIGFKGNKIDNYEDILFPPQYNFEEVEDSEYEEVEYVEVEADDDEYEYEEVEYVDVEDQYEEYEEYEEYQEIDHDNRDYSKLKNSQQEYEEYEEIIYEEYEEYEENEDENEYEEIKTYKSNPKLKSKREYYSVEDKMNKSKSSLGKQYSNEMNKNSYTYVKNNHENVKTAGTLLMPRQIKKGLKYFKEVKPFVAEYIENTRWWKIDINPTTMCGYTMPYLGYINTLNYTMYSDGAMQSYKYRHYLYGVQYDEYNKRQYYIYAVPGKKNEQPDKGHTGFTRYQPCDNRNNSLGYWLCFIDCKARKILK